MAILVLCVTITFQQHFCKYHSSVVIAMSISVISHIAFGVMFISCLHESL